MAAQLSYPGVYIEEIPSGNRTVTGVATSIAAFVGRALRGPVDEPTLIGSYAEFERVFGGLWSHSGLGYAVRDFYLNGGNNALVLRLAGGATTARIPVGGVTITASGPGLWGAVLGVEVTYLPDAVATEVAAAQGVGVAAEDLFNLTVWEGDQNAPHAIERYFNVTADNGPRRVDLVLGGSRLVHAERPAPGTLRPQDGSYSVEDPAQVGDGHPLGLPDYAGLTALARADLFNVLCLPPSEPDGDLPADVWAGALTFCREHRALLLIDPPSAMSTPTLIGQWRDDLPVSGEVARNAALYFPRVREPDPLRQGATGDFVACGAVAGVMARTDAARGVWKAPAGIDAGLVGVSALTVPLTDTENGTLNQAGINCLRTFPVVGTVVWGARTTRGADVLADEYRYVPVRRLALFLEESLYRGTQWVVFEPNDEPLWSQIRTSLGAFMQDLFRQGAFQGRTPREAYFVHCDGDTTTQYDIDRGIVNVIVGFAPLKPAEFVVISIQQKTAGATG